MLVSSANIIGSSAEDTFLRSLIYNKNGNGPKMELCGTPHLFNSVIFINLNVLQVARKITLNPCVIPISYTVQL